MGVQGSTPHRRAKHYQLQGRSHLAAPSRGPTHPGAPRTADHTDMDPKNCNAIGLGAVGPMLTTLHRRRARRLRLRPRQRQSAGCKWSTPDMPDVLFCSQKHNTYEKIGHLCMSGIKFKIIPCIFCQKNESQTNHFKEPTNRSHPI